MYGIPQGNLKRQLLPEPVCQYSESAYLHSHGKVLPLDVRRAYLFRIGLSDRNRNIFMGEVLDFLENSVFIDLKVAFA